MGLKSFFAGFLACLTLICGCAATYPYKYYGLAAASYQGRLLGDKPENDLDLLICTPTPQDAAPCIVMRSPDYLRLKADYKTLIEALNRCQSGGRSGD